VADFVLRWPCFLDRGLPLDFGLNRFIRLRFKNTFRIRHARTIHLAYIPRRAVPTFGHILSLSVIAVENFIGLVLSNGLDYLLRRLQLFSISLDIFHERFLFKLLQLRIFLLRLRNLTLKLD
jgi:hypothetical protein